MYETLTDLLYDLEPIALESGITVERYWSLTLNEIFAQLFANKAKHDVELKERAMMDYQLAQGLSYAFNNPQKMPKPEKLYPFLKEEEEQKEVEPVSQEEDFAIFMEQLNAFKSAKGTEVNQ